MVIQSLLSVSPLTTVLHISSSASIFYFFNYERLEIWVQCCMRLLVYSQTSLMSNLLLSSQWVSDLILMSTTFLKIVSLINCLLWRLVLRPPDNTHSMCFHFQDFGQIDTSRTDIINYCPENLRHRWVHKAFTFIIIIPIIILISMKMIQAMQSWSLPRAGRPMQQLGAAALGSCQGRTS